MNRRKLAVSKDEMPNYIFGQNNDTNVSRIPLKRESTQRDRWANNECKKGDQEQWDHVTVIGKVGRAIKLKFEIDLHRFQLEWEWGKRHCVSF